MKRFTLATAVLTAVTEAYFDARNIGGDGTGRDKAQAYHMAGGRDVKVMMQCNFYDKDVKERGFEVHGDVILSVVGASDEKFIDMGWCFRPVDEDQENSSPKPFDCLSLRWFYSHEQIDDINADGFSEHFIGYDLFAPRLDDTHMLPLDLTRNFLDRNMEFESTDWIQRENQDVEVIEVVDDNGEVIPAAEPVIIDADEELDPSGSWTVNTAKSYKYCPSLGNCTFNTHFYRNFLTEDQDDYQITKGENKMYEAYGYAVQYKDMLNDENRDTVFYVVGDVQKIYLENLKEMKSKELELSSAVYSSTVYATLTSAALLMLSF